MKHNCSGETHMSYINNARFRMAKMDTALLLKRDNHMEMQGKEWL